MEEMWLARDENGTLWLFTYKPRKGYDEWEQTNIHDKYSACMEIDDFLFPEVKWSDEEPTKVKLIIEK